VVELAANEAAASGGAFRVSHDMAEAFDGAEIVYPKSWTPMRVARRRTELLRKADRGGLLALEKEGLEENARHKSWQCDETLMKRSASGSALYMHCLPADISGVSCSEGEVSRGVFERYRLETYREASWKPFVIAALIFLTRTPDPRASLRRLAEAGAPRIR
jgi:ornithine carbamoyltransferase